ncbi:MAG: sigma-54-dependent Fis family transcriptional regulator [Planctomycetes bacterium]|nr:sigma-54-dependent Fis family transcriptional regulator [Planctomycetota bacterium]
MAANEKPRTIHLLVVDDDENLLDMMREHFDHKGIKLATASRGGDALTIAEQGRFDVALLDISLPDINGLELLAKFKEQHPEMEIIMLTAHAGLDSAIQAMKAGAYDYVTKPFHFNELDIHVQKAFEKAALVRRERQWVEHISFESPRYRMVGSSAAHQRVMQLIEKVAPTDATVLIRGASGTGKELVARALHYNSPRRNRPLVTVNCAALQETLLESELFGHEKGAFTGAVQTKPGLIEVAEGGTLFIDEIAEMAPGLQAKLLRVLENGHYRRVGSTHEAVADVRIVAATNKNLEEEQKNGKFREDLYYRLNVVAVSQPLLKERRDDIAELVQHFLATRRVGPTPFTITPEAMDAILQYDWPGNIRELANVLERAQILAEEQTITLDDLPENLFDHRVQVGAAPSGDPVHLREVERLHVLEVLRKEKGNKVHAAKALGISRRALYRLIKKYHLADEEVRG